jgi:hypothetical protein
MSYYLPQNRARPFSSNAGQAMANHIGDSVAALLVLPAVLLGILVPGGPVEKRSFAHIPPLVLGAFNTFLAVLGIGSLALAYFSRAGNRWVFVAAALCGIS